MPENTFLHGTVYFIRIASQERNGKQFFEKKQKQNNALFDVRRGKRELIAYSANEKPDQLRIRAVQCLPFPPFKIIDTTDYVGEQIRR